MYIELIKRDNYSMWIRDRIEAGFIKEGNGNYLKYKIKEHEDAIKELKDQLENNGNKDQEIKELLAYHAPTYQQNALYRSEAQRHKFLEKSVMPQLKKLGCKQTTAEIDDILINFPTGEGSS